MALSLVLFDLDDTLIDFKGSEKWALKTTCERQKLSHPFDDYYPVYHNINRKLWSSYEQGHLKKEQLRSDRFRLLCEHFSWTADFETMANDYLETLNTHVELLPEAHLVCEALSKHFDLGVVTNGFAKVQKERFAKSGLSQFFKFVIISEEQGYPKPDQRIFIDAVKKLPGKEPSQTLMVGDRIETDILGAQRAGLQSCWLNLNKGENTSTVRADIEINELSELLKKIL